MPSFKCVLLEHGYASTQIEEQIIAEAGGTLIDAENLPPEDALNLCQDAQGILCRRTLITADMISRFRHCRMLLRYGVGTDNIDIAAATQAGILVGHVPVYCVDEVSTHAIALLLACVRKLSVQQHKLQLGHWDIHRQDPVHRLQGKTLGIIGLGNIGREVAQKLAPWSLRILATDPYLDSPGPDLPHVTLTDLDTLCRESDLISIHCPLLPETHHLIDAQRLALMKPGAILVNTARGPVVDTQALRLSLDQNRLAAAALDVFEEEPLPPDSPFRRHPKIQVSDHTAWYSEESQAELQTKAAQEIARVCTGQLPFSAANPDLILSGPRASEWVVPEHVKWQLKRRRLLGVQCPVHS